MRRAIRQIKRGLWVGLWLCSFWTAIAFSAQSLEPQTVVGRLVDRQAHLSFADGFFADGSAAGESDIEKGVDAFEQGRLERAIAHWRVALSAIERNEAKTLTRAYLLSNLATAYQQTGNLDEAQRAAAAGLALVDAWPARDDAYWEVAARVWNSQGRVLYQLGQMQQALVAWQQATEGYRRVQQVAGEVRSQLNQAIALQALGFNVRAVRLLTQVSAQVADLGANASERVDDLPLQMVLAKELGRALRQVGELSQARTVLAEAERLALLADSATDIAIENAVAEVKLELGHTLRTLSHREKALGREQQAKTYQAEALVQYATVGERSADSEVALQVWANLNQLSYLIEVGDLAQARAMTAQVDVFGLSEGRSRLEASVSYAHSLNCLQAPSSTCVKAGWRASEGLSQATILDSEQTISEQTTNEQTISEQTVSKQTTNEQAVSEQTISEQTTNKQAIAVLIPAIEDARSLGDSLLESYAVGELGYTYEIAGQTSEAIDLTRTALALIEDKQIPEAAYRWEWQLGRLYRESLALENAQSASQLAIAAYKQATDSLSKVRKNLLLANSQTQFSFRDDVEPLYREFVALLLSQSESGEKEKEAESLSLAIETIDTLQVTELEDFLGCDVAQLLSLVTQRAQQPSSLQATDSSAARIYPILLSDQLALIIDIPGQPLSLRETQVSQDFVEETISALRENLTLPGRTPEVLLYAAQLYDWIIAPLLPILQANEQIATLVFVPDGALRNIPLGVLYDGEQYLIEKKYAIATAPQLSLFAPGMANEPLRVVRGGVSIPQTVRNRRFPSIELVQAELAQIPDELTVAPPLLNESFTQNNLEQQLSNERYNAIHWKTHGVFSADPSETFLVAYEDSITANELSDLVTLARRRRTEPLELLVLSACETAKGDQRAVLGLAGIAVRAGTRSTLSTLWRADDGANTLLMESFYQDLQAGLTKAEALRRSQQRLITELGYPAPYYWAPYVLVGNWL